MPDQEQPDLENFSVEFPGHEVLSLLGEGGFGEVYHCRELEGLKREVAIKVIRLGMGTREILARFDAEMHALAKMNHDHVARVIGSGATGQERPYFIMDYIDGLTLVDWIDQQSPTLAVRLDVMQQICSGVQHAHSKGIIHRDLKPGNIIITEHEGKPRAKVIDFGLAKALSDPLTDKTLMTGDRYILGTWDYISPEQAWSHGSDVDIRSDVYSLGGILYRLLTGQTPHERLRGHHETEILRILSEETPERPSRRLGESSGRYNSEASPALRTELDWIILKALEVEPDRRYSTVQALSEDIDRHLLGTEPVIARPPSIAYKLSKYVRRYRTSLAATAVVIIALSAGISWALIERNQAQTRSQELEQLTRFQSEQLGSLDAYALGITLREGLASKLEGLAHRNGLDAEETAELLQGYETLVSGADFTGLALESLDTHIFKKTEEAIDEEYTDQPLLRARLLHTLGKVMFLTGLLERGIGPSTEALSIRRNLLEEGDDQLLRSMRLLGQIYTRLGRFPEALIPLTEAYETSHRIHGPDHEQSIESMSSLGDLEARRGNLPRAEELLTSAFESLLRSRDEEDHDTYLTRGRLAWLLAMQGDFERAEELIRQSIDGFRSVVGNDHMDTQSALTVLGNLLGMQGRYDEITPFFEEVLETRRRILGNEHPQTLMAINSMGHLLHRQGSLDQAVVLYKESLDGFRRNLGNAHHDTMLAANNLGVLLLDLGEVEKAEPYLLEAREGRKQILGLDHVDTQTSRNDVGMLRLKQGDLAAAEDLLLSSHRWLLNHHGPGHLVPFESLDRLRILYEETNEPEAFAQLWHEIHDPIAGTPAAASPAALASLTRFGSLLLNQEKFSEARGILAPAEESAVQVLLTEDPLRCAEFLCNLCLALLGDEFDGAYGEIESRLNDAHQLALEAEGRSDPVSLSCQRALILLYSNWHEASPDGGFEEQLSHWQDTLRDSMEAAEPTTD
jgi:non-specific serine/threonine protein kinase/serine/threonine-protein kinase